MRYYVPIKIPGYEALIRKPEKHEKDKDLPCAKDKCNGKRSRLKSGRYDPYCKSCRSKVNREYRIKRGRGREMKDRKIKYKLWGNNHH